MSLLIAELVDESTFPLSSGPLEPDVTGRRITGARVLLEWIVRSWLQRRGRNRLAPNAGVDIRELQNATIDARKLEAWRVALGATAKAACIGYLETIDVLVQHANRTTTITARAYFVDGTTDVLAVRLAAVGSLLKFGGSL